MENNKNDKEKQGEKISELNNIFEDLISDARGLAEDLIGGIKLTFIVGILSIVFGIQTSWANKNYILQGDLIPLLLAAAIVISGTIIIFRGFVLRKKYARLIQTHKKIGK